MREHAAAEIAIIGGGISGALVAWHLHQAGFRVLLVDRRHIGMGSTAASTALLQYEIDTPLRELILKAGKKNAVKSYQLCRQAIDDIEKIVRRVKGKDIFHRRPSFQFASFKKDVPGLQQEFTLRSQGGIALQWLEERDIREKYGFSKAAGLLSEDGAELDAYRLTHLLLDKCMAGGLQVYDHTGVADIRHTKKGVELVTDTGKKIRAQKLVIACGYESQRYIPFRVQQLQSTYVIISEPFLQTEFWHRNSLIWETRQPYLYLRTTADNRILVGGKDVPFSDPVKRDQLLPAKARSLERSFARLFPSIPFRTDFKWAGTFAATKDGLPYIGSIRQHPDTWFALGFGGNGITFSILAAQIIRDSIKGNKNEAAGIFSFDR